MKIARASGQRLLFDTPPRFKLGSNALARNAYGAAAQEIVCCALNLAPTAIDGNCEFCPDAENLESGIFFEIKSVHRGGKVVVYDWRMKKEARCGVPLRYAILTHNCRKLKDGDRLISDFALAGCEIISLPAAVVHDFAAVEPLQTMKNAKEDNEENPRNGYSRKGYADGYRNLPVGKLRTATTRERMLCFELHGIRFDIPLLK